jgi:hypothetical protein
MTFIGPYPNHLPLGRGQVGDHVKVLKYGNNTAFGTTEEDIQSEGSVRTAPTTAAAASVAFSAADGAGLAGARKVIVEGLDANLDPCEEEVTLTSSPETTTQTFFRVFRAYVTEGGTYANTYTTPFGTNAQNIDISVGGNVQVRIPQGFGQTLTTHYTVRAGYTAYLGNVFAINESTQPARLTMWQRQNADDTSVPVSSKRVVTTLEGLDSALARDYRYMISFPEKTDIWWSAVLLTGSTGTAGAEYELIMVKNT